MRAEILENAPGNVVQTPELLAHLRADGSFDDLNYSGTSDASGADYREHGWRLGKLGQAFHWDDPANPWHQDGLLKSRILQAFEFIANKARGVSSVPNWWWKEIGVPNGFNEALLLMRDELSSTLRSRMLSKYYGLAWSIGNDDGANLTYHAPAAMTQAVLTGNAARIKDVVQRVSAELSAYRGEGILHDLSFYQHGNKPNWHSGSYGMVFARDVAQVMRWTAGTSYAFPASAVEQHLRYVLDHLAWMSRGKLLEPTSQGRSITRTDNIGEKFKTLRGVVVDMLTLGRRTDELAQFLARLDQGHSGENHLHGNKSLWRVDGMLHQRADFMAAVRMLSSRTLRPETAAGQNTKGYFEGDGLTTLLKDGDEYGAPGGPQLYDAWDWQRLPGTTVEHNGLIPYYNMFGASVSTSGLSNLVGSASDGTYGLAMMDYRRSGVSVTARKSWFFFDEEMVALGADIDAPNAVAPVFTSLNQVLLDGPITVRNSGGSQWSLELGQSLTIPDVAWVHHDGMGYVFLQPAPEATVQAVMQSSDRGPELPVFSTWINHGSALQDGSYAYAVVAGKTPQEVAAYEQTRPVRILSNTASLQAVRHDGLKQTQAAFFAAGSLDIGPDLRVSVDQPVLLIVTERGDELEITVADPRKSLTAVNVEVNRTVLGEGAVWTADRGVTRITFALPKGGFAGSSVTRRLLEVAGPPSLLSPVQDAQVRSGSYADLNFGQAARLAVQNQAGSIRESLLQFDLSQLGGQVARAILKLVRLGGTSSVKLEAAPSLLADWTEDAVTWNTRPAAGLALGPVTSLAGKPLWIDVTALAQAAVAAGGNLSLRLAAPAGGAPLAEFGSSESTLAGQRPVLEIYLKKPTMPPLAPPLAEGEVVEAFRADEVWASGFDALPVGEHAPQASHSNASGSNVIQPTAADAFHFARQRALFAVALGPVAQANALPVADETVKRGRPRLEPQLDVGFEDQSDSIHPQFSHWN
jgi:chondroitin AC lyase